ncbi:MAG: transposase [Steroidobacter sp.]
MPRTARAIVGGYCYHLINRGNDRARVFHEHADYAHFVSLIGKAQERVTVPLLAACLMPNHIHLVVRPEGDADLSCWTHWLFTTHVRRYHAKYGSAGRVWQDRFKAFVIQEDRHLLTVMRYVERNAVRAALVARAEHWLWGSLRWRDTDQNALLTPSPVRLPSNWLRYVNEAQTAAELDALRACVNRQRPFGTQAWVGRKARELGLSSSLTRIGRPGRDRRPAEMGTVPISKAEVR